MKSAQVGATEGLNNVIGYHVDNDPCSMLLVQPTESMANTHSKTRLAPMFRDTVCLADKVRPSKRGDSSNSILSKQFPGGLLRIAWSNSPAQLASSPIRIVLCDEVDRYPVSAGAEGDPVELAFKRTTTFFNRKKFCTGTPTIKGLSRIEAKYLASDQRRYHLACHECGHKQPLRWEQVKWEKGSPEGAWYECESCCSTWNDGDIARACRSGEWVAENPGARIRGWHINELYSPWKRLAETVADFLEVKEYPELLKTWVNLALGETWEDEHSSINHHELFLSHRAQYEAVPEPVRVVTAGVDVQQDRLEVEILGTAPNQETWSIDFHVLIGDPRFPDVWQKLDDLRRTPLNHEEHGQISISAVCVDSGAFTDEVYRYTGKRFREAVYAVKGRTGKGHRIVERYTPRVKRPRTKKGPSTESPLFILGVDAAKDLLYARLAIAEVGPGFCHFPMHYEAEYFEELCSHRKIIRYSKGQPEAVWIKDPKMRDEKLDCRVYAMAALEILAPEWAAIDRRLHRRPPAPEPETPAYQRQGARNQMRRPRQGFVRSR